MRIVKRWLLKQLQYAERTGQTGPLKMTVVFTTALFFLWVPDFDLLLLSVLHHRSIITHSLLPAFLLLYLTRTWGTLPFIGALIGLSVHMACDALSPSMTGFAQIWLPAPFKQGIGPLSYLWLAGSAFAGFYLAFKEMARANFSYELSGYVYVFIGGCALLYGFLNERSLLAIAIVSVLAVMSRLLVANKFR